MEILLVRFDQANGVRQFAFDCIAEDRSRTKVIVRADLSLARKYNILLQELPSLCRRLIQDAPQDELRSSFTLTEDHMLAIQIAARDMVQKKTRKTHRPSPLVGQAWRTHAFTKPQA